VGGDEPRLRLFCALRLPEDVVDRLADWQRRHLTAGRVVPPEHLHVTTAFLGGRPASDVPRVLAALAAAEPPGPIRFRVQGYRETRGVGMLVLDDLGGNGAGYAARLQERLEVMGVYRREARPWLPHVTVVRFRERPRLDPPLPEPGELAPSDAAAFLSRLSPSGAQYEVLETVALGG
jgi:2'-5' RNA ligase